MVAMSERIHSGASPSEVRADLKGLVNFEDNGMEADVLSRELEQKLIPHLANYSSPEFQSMFNAFPEEGALIGSYLALRYNQGVTNWQVSPGGAVLEELCCTSLCELFGLRKKSEATFMYSGTYGNQQALYLALHRHAEKKGFDYSSEGMGGFENPDKLRIVVAEDVHFSIVQAARFLGLGENALLKISLDENLRIDPAAVIRTLGEHNSDYEAVCVVVTMGSTITGSVDEISDISKVCSDKGIWLHADGAYGLAYSLLPEKKPLFRGLRSSDSIVWDPHKQFGVPIPSSLLFLKDGENFKRVNVHSDYFNRKEEEMPNPGLKSPPSTRPFSALPLVTSIKSQGLRALRKRLRASINAVNDLAEALVEDAEIEIMNKPDTGVICFRVRPMGIGETDLCKLQEYVYNEASLEGARAISTASIEGKKVLRLVSVSPEVTVRALKSTILSIKETAKSFAEN